MSENFRGALIMMICMGAFVLNDAFVRLAGDSLPLAQILFIRGLITTAVLLSFAIYGGVFSLTISKKDKWRIFFRSIAEALSAYFFLTAVMNMPFANVTAILQILPMTVTLAAAFVFKEKVGIIRITLILAGFLGVVLIINPSTDGFNLYAIYALIAVFLIILLLWALTTNISFLGYEILNINLPKYLFAVLSIFSSTGRFAWPVIYLILIVSFIIIYRNTK